VDYRRNMIGVAVKTNTPDNAGEFLFPRIQE
jgi:hypothetical protein